MVFSSYIFLFWFLPIALLLYYIVKGKSKAWILTLSSYIFYGWTNPLFVILLFVSTCIDYVCGLVLIGYPHIPKDNIPLLERGGKRTFRQKMAVSCSVISNLSLLAFFKYGNFGIENWNMLMQSIFTSDTFLLPSLHIILPLGISFYTFQSMSYAIDVYRGDAKGTASFINFACYVSMFPQLVAGPIIRYQEVADQLTSRIYSYEKFARGIAFFILGMGQKILLANPCGKMADLAFDTPGRTLLDAWTGMIAYSFQILFDFAGYSNMAIGLGLMLGFVFPKNFDYPYRSLSITEFWRRWHISLSSWLRDYLYIPLGGNRKGAARTYVNLMLVMLLGGLWHGSSWNFVIWGMIHGIALATERYYGIENRNKNFRWLYWAYTYSIVLIAWVFFRAPTFSEAISYIGSLFGIGSNNPSAALVSVMILTPYHLFSFLLAGFIVAAAPSAWAWTREMGKIKWCCLLLLFALAIMALMAQSYNPFIYFIF